MSASYKETRGSIILAALIITLITGSLVGLFLNTVTQEIRNAYRARMGFQAVNLAEAGLEYAIHAMITDDWNGWQAGGKGYYRDTFTEISSAYTGVYRDTRKTKVYVQPTWKKNGEIVPVAVAEGAISLKNGLVVRRQIRIEMQKGSSTPWKRGWGNGILGKDGVTFKGNKVWIDSYRSSDPNNVLGYPPGYDPLAPLDNGSVASLSIKTGAISVGNADVYGRVATGGGKPDVGANGSIYGAGQKIGTIDSDRIALDFYANIPDPEVPLLDTPETTLSGTTLGTLGTTQDYQLTEFNIKAGEIYTVEGNVRLYVTGNIDIKGQLTIAEDSSIEIYVDGSTYIGGTGIVNLTGRPENNMMFGTGVATTVKIHGSGYYIGVIHAPNSEVELKGGGTSDGMFGATVGKSVLFDGTYAFHYDEDLADLEDDDDDTGTFVPVVNDWAELSDGGIRITDWEDLLKTGFADVN